jgi:flagellar basal-body rod protein FlgB
LHVFQLASQHSAWVAARQAAAAINIANADTPGYRAIDVVPFESALSATRLAMTATRPGHLAAPHANFGEVDTRPAAQWDVAHSGNNVAIEAELIKVGENGRMAAFDTGVAKVFHRMLLLSLKV